jgi:mono/diheme cytochrome c family protein
VTFVRLCNIALMILLVLSLGLHLVLRRTAGQPNPDLFPDMVHTARYNAFAPNPYFASGATLQVPDPRTSPHNGAPLAYGPGAQEAARAARDLRNPLSAQEPASLERGKIVFSNFCQPCHGSAGRGDGPVVARGFPAPPSLVAEHAQALPDGHLFHIVTHGQGNMAGYAAQLSQADRWKAILFVRSLQRQGNAAALGGSR